MLALSGGAAAGEVTLLAQDTQLFLGEDFLPWMVLAFGAAMVVGNVLALLRPPAPDASGAEPSAQSGAPEQLRPKPPIGRAVTMIVIGLLAATWGAASLLS